VQQRKQQGYQGDRNTRPVLWQESHERYGGLINPAHEVMP